MPALSYVGDKCNNPQTTIPHPFFPSKGCDGNTPHSSTVFCLPYMYLQDCAPTSLLHTCHWPADWCSWVLLCQGFTYGGVLWFVIYYLHFSSCVERASQHCHLSTVLCSTVQCRLALCFLLSLFPLSASSSDNLLLGICTGMGARRYVTSAGRSVFVTILQIRTVLSRQGLICPLSLDLAKLVLDSFQPAFSQVAHACEFRHPVK